MSALGQIGEDLAAAHLTELGYKILTRNWHCDRGELDIVAQDGNVLVFIEVKTRRSTRCGTAQEAIDQRKQEKLRHLAHRYIHATNTTAAQYRFDVVAVHMAANDKTITVIANAF